MLMKPARTLEEIATNCTPDPLENDKLKSFFVETADARDEKSHLRDRLVGIFNKDEIPKRVLVYGHRGCGKSTELNCFKAEDIVLALAVAICDKLNDKNAKVGDEKPRFTISQSYLLKIHDFFAELTVTDTKEHEAKLKAAAEAGVGSNALWALVFKLKASVSSELSYGSKGAETSIQKLRKRPGDLLLAVNDLIHAVEDGLKEHGKKLMLIVEDLDKLQLADANDVFVQNNLLLSRLNTNIIYTIPIFTFYTPDRDVIHSAFDAHLHLQMIKTFQRDGTRAAGYDKVKEIILKRVDPAMIDADALDLLIRGTGGVLRHVFEVLQEVSSYYNIRDNHIRKQNIRDALNNLRINIGTAIGWPLDKDGGQKPPDDLYDALFEAAKVQAAGDVYQPKNNQAVHILLRCCALVEYNSKRWLGVHPLAWEYLVGEGRNAGKNPCGIEP